MKTKLFIIVFSMLFLGSSGALAGNDNTGTSCANFLKIGIGPRAEAMGGAFVALADDWTALYWNPAGLTHIERLEVGFARTEWILDITHSFLGAVYSPGGNWGTIGVSINYLDMGEMERTTPMEPHGTGTFFTPRDMAIGVAYARTLTDRFTVGVKAKFVRETISYCSASTIAIDVGTQFVTGFYGMRLGMAITNFGGKMLMMGTDQMVKADIDPLIEGNPEKEARLETENWPLPMTFRFGVSMDVLNTEYSRFTVNMDMNDPRDVSSYGNIGVEYGWKDMVFLRSGLIYRPDRFDETKMAEKEELDLIYKVKFSFGGGLNLTVPGMDTKVGLDYAYSDLGRLDYMHRFSVKFSF